MGLDKVVQNILEEGRRAAQTQLEAARKEAGEILADAEGQASTFRGKREQETAAAVEALKRREVAAAELEAKKLRLNAQKDVLLQVHQAVLDRLAKLPPETRGKHVQALAKSSTIRNGRVYVSAKDEESARKAGLDVAGTIPAVGGVVVASADGSLREDLTYENLLEEVWSTSLHDVASILFAK